MKKILDILWIIIHPSYWNMNFEYSKDWDRDLNELMLSNNFEKIYGGVCICKLGKNVIWVANHPYASFSFRFMVRPSRMTIKKAHEKMISDLLSSKEG